jgi:hypothetical protein
MAVNSDSYIKHKHKHGLCSLMQSSLMLNLMVHIPTREL